ncbi:DUF6503 family protein [Olleya aquimaris]|uniref:Outer membrane lipoprotein-sorting protein n=1 Tax=Olleya aquimaris TaxID=639310 RepID=A0A327RDE3_9FLAO|nr:DUF6503 family protein [Olleya aquimaris]RAJ15026.1 hypothetical protein LY08_01375 [Olleya aquimaris]
MKTFCSIILFILSFYCSTAQTLTGQELLDKAIKYHDPNNQWKTFNDTLFVTMETPKNADRDSKIIINLPKEFFYVKAQRDTITTEYTVTKDTCKIVYNGRSKVSDALAKAKNLNCERATLYKNYYTYLYGLPMKLKDPGTTINPKVEQVTFKDKPYLKLKVTYDAAVGKDIWYFYFNPKTYAMEVYQFFKTDEDGNENPESGEYILLSETETVSDIKIPKVRAWYYNKDNLYLGTDILKK